MAGPAGVDVSFWLLGLEGVEFLKFFVCDFLEVDCFAFESEKLPLFEFDLEQRFINFLFDVLGNGVRFEGFSRVLHQ